MGVARKSSIQETNKRELESESQQVDCGSLGSRSDSHAFIGIDL